MILLQSFGSGLAQLFFPLAILAVFFFFIYRPEQKRKQRQSDFISSLKKGKKVVTNGGIHGKITSIEGNSVILDVDRGTKIKFDKNSISFEMSSQENN